MLALGMMSGTSLDGVDAAHKLSILASIAFGTRPAFGDVGVSGIRHVLAADIAEAAALGPMSSSGARIERASIGPTAKVSSSTISVCPGIRTTAGST